MENLIKKYEPKKLEEFNIHTKQINVINMLLKSDVLTILIIGNNNCGKTSIVKTIKNLYEPGMVMEINTLTDQGISYCRNDLKIFCQSTNPNNKKKLVLLDDIDFITEQNQQVLRNYIDKYRKNVNFVCTGASIQKVIESLQSRLFIIKLNDVKEKHIKDILDNVCLREKIILPDDCRNFIVKNSGFSIQNMICCLEKIKLMNKKKIDLILTTELCTTMNYMCFKKYTKACSEGDFKEAIKIVYNIYDTGYSVIDILDCYFVFIKHNSEMDEKTQYKIIKTLCKYISLFYNFHENELELASFTNEIINLYK